MKKDKIDPSRLTAHIGFWMRTISNHVSYAFARKLASHDVTVAEWVVLREMYAHHGTTSPSHIAQLTGLSRGAVSKLIDRLLDKRLVTRKESREDRRYQDIELTKIAVTRVPTLAAAADENDKEFFEGLSRTERTVLTNVLKKLAELHKITKMPTE